MSSRKSDHPAAAFLRGIIVLIDKSKGKATEKLIGEVYKLTINALEVLNNPDPITERIATVFLMLRLATRVDKRIIRGKGILRVTIIDNAGYNWAMEQVHSLGSQLEKSK